MAKNDFKHSKQAKLGVMVEHLCTVCDVLGYSTMIVEIVLLHLFGFSWIVKGEAFPFLNGVEENS